MNIRSIYNEQEITTNGLLLCVQISYNIFVLYILIPGRVTMRLGWPHFRILVLKVLGITTRAVIIREYTHTTLIHEFLIDYKPTLKNLSEIGQNMSQLLQAKVALFRIWVTVYGGLRITVSAERL